MHSRQSIYVGAACLALTGPTWAESDATDLLQRARIAMETLNYEGRFIHQVGDSVEVNRIVHRVVDGRVQERVISENGQTEILREGDKVTCFFAAQRSAVVEYREDHGPLKSAVPGYSDRVGAHYDVVRERDARWMKRDAAIISIRPRDAYRYGFTLWVDMQTYMPVKSMVLDAEGNRLEQLYFISLEVRDSIPDEIMNHETDDDGFEWYVSDRMTVAKLRSADARWQAADMPPGFQLESAGRQMLPGTDHEVDHLVYSDGLASVSVFVEPAEKSDQSMAGATRIGSASAYTAMIDGHQVTAVGEVPGATVKRIARSVQRADRTLEARR